MELDNVKKNKKLRNLQNQFDSKGKQAASVPLLTETTNKELLNSVGKKSLVLRDLLGFIGINIRASDRRFVCVKCARKVANCYKVS